MDEVLEILEKDARISPDDIANMLNLTREEVAGKIADYEERGIILGYKAIINKEKLGVSHNKVRALIEVKVAPEKDVGFDNIAKRIYSFDEVKSCYLLSGDYDLLLIIEGDDIHTVAGFVAEKLSPMKNVRGTSTHFLLKKYKEDGIMLVEKNEATRMPISY